MFTAIWDRLRKLIVLVKGCVKMTYIKWRGSAWSIVRRASDHEKCMLYNKSLLNTFK